MADYGEQPGAAADDGGGAAREVRWWDRMWVRLTVSFVMIATIPLAITTMYTARKHIVVLGRMAREAVNERTQRKADELSDLLADVRNENLAIAEWPLLESFLAHRGDAAQDAYWQRKLEVQLKTFMELNAACGTVAITSRGQTLAIERRGPSTVVTEVGDPRVMTPEMASRVATLLPRQTELEWRRRGDGSALVVSAARIPRSARGIEGAVWTVWDIGGVLRDVEGADHHVRTTLSDDAGEVVFDSGELRASAGADADLLRSSARVSAGDRTDWTLRRMESTGVLDDAMRDFRRAFLVVLLGSLVLALCLGVVISRQVTRPVGRLLDASRMIGRGRFDVALPDDTGDELGALSRQVSVMADRLRESHESFERRLDEKTRELVQAERLATIGRTAAAVAHEINNPSGIISLYAQMLLERATSDGGMREHLQVINSKSREISEIVRELLDYARKPAPVKRPVALGPLVSGALESAMCLLEGEAAAARYKTEIDVAADVPAIEADPNQLSRLIRNLVTNALHAMPGGGTLAVTARLASDEADGRGRVVISVVDTGTGIEADAAAHLFDPFFSTKAFGTGTGLGLAISKEIVERHAGTIGVASKPGEGTVVTVTLPIGDTAVGDTSGGSSG